MSRLHTLALATALFGAAFAANAQTRSAHTEVLGFDELEQIAIAEGITPTKLEARDLLLKVEGFDADGRKVKLHLDRRTGDVLSRELKIGKHERWMYRQDGSLRDGTLRSGGLAPRTR